MLKLALMKAALSQTLLRWVIPVTAKFKNDWVENRCTEVMVWRSSPSQEISACLGWQVQPDNGQDHCLQIHLRRGAAINEKRCLNSRVTRNETNQVWMILGWRPEGCEYGAVLIWSSLPVGEMEEEKKADRQPEAPWKGLLRHTAPSAAGSLPCLPWECGLESQVVLSSSELIRGVQWLGNQLLVEEKALLQDILLFISRTEKFLSFLDTNIISVFHQFSNSSEHQAAGATHGKRR